MRLALLLLLALPAPASEPRDSSHDRDGDGVVTDKEERLHRRDERRARRADRRAARGTDEDDGGSTTEEDDARQAAAAGKASRLADAMKAMLPSADAGALPGAAPGGSGAAAAGRPPAAGPASGAAAVAAPAPPEGAAPSSGDPANPRSAADLLLAARGPYAPALEKAGLRLSADGRGFVRLSDGKPATAEDLERLRAGVLAMPAALARRPDFHRHVSPEHFAALRKGYRESRPASVYKDVGATEKERDFVHTRSCETMSGDCNEHARKKAAYKKGEYVAPEDLERMYAGLQEELASSEEDEEPATSATRPRPPGDEASPSEEETGPGGPAAAAPARTPEQKRAAAEREAYENTPAFLAAPLRRVIARSAAWLSPTAASSPYLMWRVWLALGALLALAVMALRRRD